MEYIHIRNLHKYHPGYKDRTLQWAKIHINMADGDPDTEMIDNEIDWARLIKMILLELRAQKPLPNIDRFWEKKGFNIKKRSMSLTIQMLHNFIEVVTIDEKQCVLDKSRVEENRVDKSRVDNGCVTEIITDLNLVLGTEYKPLSKTKDLIQSRLNEGFKVEDFKQVHRKMLCAWGADEKMVKFLRPITLYSPKFESYLQQKSITTKLTPEGVKAYFIGQSWLKSQEVIDVK